MNKITEIKALEIVDNRGMPTIRVKAEVDGQFIGVADVPSGSSTGSSEAIDLRDGGSRYRGRGVRKAIANIHETIAPDLKGKDASAQRDIDERLIELDGTENKSKLGANATLGVSYAVAKAAAAAADLPLYHYLNPSGHLLPVPQTNMIGGGLHAGNDLAFQEYFVMPVGAPSFAEAVRYVSEISLIVKDLLESKFGSGATNAGEDGGFAPPMKSSHDVLELIYEAVAQAGFADEVIYGLDVASTHFYDRETKTYNFEGEKRDRDEMIGFLVDLVNKFPGLVTLEDSLYEDDFEGTAIIAKKLTNALIIGDDFFTTNPERLKRGVEEQAGNAILWKPNMIGTLTEAIDVAHYAEENNFTVVVSERSGATEDTTLSDLTVAINSGMFKDGGMRGSEHGSRKNRLLEIENELGAKAVYAGRNFNKKAQ